MEFTYQAFTADNIITLVNNTLKAAGKRIKVDQIIRSENEQVVLKTTTGKRVVAILWSPSRSLLGVRGIHKINNSFSNYTYLFNGQPGKNLTQLVFLGESGDLVSTSLEQYSSFLKYHYKHQADKQIFYRSIKESLMWEVQSNPKLSSVKGILAFLSGDQFSKLAN